MPCAPQGSKLVLEEQPEAGVCGSECKTIAKAALEIVGDHDTDIAEMLWKAQHCNLNAIFIPVCGTGSLCSPYSVPAATLLQRRSYSRACYESCDRK